MAPTRELAIQVHDDFKAISQSLSLVCIYGGAPYYPQGKIDKVVSKLPNLFKLSLKLYQHLTCAVWLTYQYIFTESAMRSGVDVVVGTPGRILDHLK